MEVQCGVELQCFYISLFLCLAIGNRDGREMKGWGLAHPPTRTRRGGRILICMKSVSLSLSLSPLPSSSPLFCRHTSLSFVSASNSASAFRLFLGASPETSFTSRQYRPLVSFHFHLEGAGVDFPLPKRSCSTALFSVVTSVGCKLCMHVRFLLRNI